MAFLVKTWWDFPGWLRIKLREEEEESVCDRGLILKPCRRSPNWRVNCSSFGLRSLWLLLQLHPQVHLRFFCKPNTLKIMILMNLSLLFSSDWDPECSIFTSDVPCSTPGSHLHTSSCTSPSSTSSSIASSLPKLLQRKIICDGFDQTAHEQQL